MKSFGSHSQTSISVFRKMRIKAAPSPAAVHRSQSNTFLLLPLHLTDSLLKADPKKSNLENLMLLHHPLIIFSDVKSPLRNQHPVKKNKTQQRWLDALRESLLISRAAQISFQLLYPPSLLYAHTDSLKHTQTHTYAQAHTSLLQILSL